MIDITAKQHTLRKAVATAKLILQRPAAMQAVLQKKVPKGDVFEFSRAAGLLAIKKTAELIPDCHPIPIEMAAIRFSTDAMTILIEVEVHTVYKTGVEVEAMHGASVVALTMYDMLKPLDKEIEISSIRLSHKSGGKSNFLHPVPDDIRAAVVVCSDRVAAGTKEDKSGSAIIEKLKTLGLDSIDYRVIPDDRDAIESAVKELMMKPVDLIIFTGGTGVSPRDITTDIIEPMLETAIPGVMEAARNYGQLRTPYAMLSRGVAGFIGNTLLLTLPGSLSGAKDSMQALFPYVLHLISVRAGADHEENSGQ